MNWVPKEPEGQPGTRKMEIDNAIGHHGKSERDIYSSYAY
jgi:hypothetical protein